MLASPRQKSRITTRLPTTQLRTDRKGSVIGYISTKVSPTSVYQYQVTPDTAKPGINPSLYHTDVARVTSGGSSAQKQAVLQKLYISKL
ncbi:hypothetical protein AVEN_54800-1 [Araneus ventricosus]|uniref:Uncharacterized protein n=1 Tax=Araneus ventricosus TaxID=182803 RepID=A0A4Y2U061_ARAVE|nr:hypothetical protein AVEN_54800-1 [Araneus ventricosus]